MTRSLALLATLGLYACAHDVEGTDASADAVSHPDSATATPFSFPVDAQGCLDTSALHSSPIPLAGHMVVTYFEPSLEQNHCELDENKEYWCTSPTKTSDKCTDSGGTIYCPNPSPTAEQLGDPQELAAFDLANTAAGPQRWTHNATHEAELDISPDNTKVIYAVRDHMDDFVNGHGIWMSDIDGQNAHVVVNLTGFTGIPTWIPPNSDKFSFITDDGLQMFDLATNTQSKIDATGFDLGYAIDPEAAHDGKHFTFKADTTGGNAPSIYVMDFDGAKGSNVKRLTHGYSDHDPVFSRDNEKIYFERYYGPGEWNAKVDKIEHPENNQWGIVEVDPTTASERVVVPHDKCGKHFWWLPTLSPDGKYVMFIHDYVAPDGYQDLWVAEVSGANPQPVPSTKGFHWFDWN